MVTKNTIGERIQYFIGQIPHLTQNKLAEKLGVSQSKVSEWINNIKEPKPTELQSMANIFGISVYVLIPNKGHITNNGNFSDDAIVNGHQTIHNHQDIEALKKSNNETVEALKEINQFLKQENIFLKQEISLLKTQINKR